MKALYLLALLSIAPTVSAGCLRYQPASSTISGKVVKRTFYGPPNFGEDPATDSREMQLLLQLKHPICTVNSADELDPAEQHQAQVTILPNGTDLMRFLGKNVTIVGGLMHASTAHHHTSLLIQPKNVRQDHGK